MAKDASEKHDDQVLPGSPAVQLEHRVNVVLRRLTPRSCLRESHEINTVSQRHFEHHDPLVTLDTEPIEGEIGPSEDHRDRVGHDVIVLELADVRGQHYPEKGRH